MNKEKVKGFWKKGERRGQVEEDLTRFFFLDHVQQENIVGIMDISVFVCIHI